MSKKSYDFNFKYKRNDDVYLTSGLLLDEYIVNTPVVKMAEYYELHIITNGKGSLMHNGNIYNFSRGGLFFFHAGEKYEIVSTGAESVNVIQIVFSDFFMYPFDYNTITFLSVPYAHKRLFYQCNEDEYDDVMGIYNKLYSRKSVDNDYDRIYGITALNWLLLNYMVTDDSEDRSLRKNYIADELVFHTHNAFFQSDFTLQSAADYVGVSKDYASHLFKETMGISFQKFVLDSRLSLAYDMVVRTKSSITKISEACGFNSFSYFMRAFKKHYGDTPLSIRRKRLAENSGNKEK